MREQKRAAVITPAAKSVAHVIYLATGEGERPHKPCLSEGRWRFGLARTLGPAAGGKVAGDDSTQEGKRNGIVVCRPVKRLGF